MRQPRAHLSATRLRVTERPSQLAWMCVVTPQWHGCSAPPRPALPATCHLTRGHPLVCTAHCPYLLLEPSIEASCLSPPHHLIPQSPLLCSTLHRPTALDSTTGASRLRCHRLDNIKPVTSPPATRCCCRA
jgi:hypothetical protein